MRAWSRTGSVLTGQFDVQEMNTRDDVFTLDRAQPALGACD